jgi:hypothetical protein
MEQMENQNTNIGEFIFLGKSMESVSITYGIFLIIWGVAVSFISGSNSLTSFIPSIFGLPILLFSFLAAKFPNKKKTIYAYGCIIWINCIYWRLRFFKRTNKGNIIQ